MFKLIVLFAAVAVCMSAPVPSGLIAYSAPASAPVQVVSPVLIHVVSPSVISYSAHSSSVVHSAPVYAVPVDAPLVPLTYSSGLVQPVFV